VSAEDNAVDDWILAATRSGDAEVNDCAIHPLFPELPFGGVGNSGMGKYHGNWGFEAFTNARGVLHHSTLVDPGVRYPRYAKRGLERVICQQADAIARCTSSLKANACFYNSSNKK
jgi:hypothetical protein